MRTKVNIEEVCLGDIVTVHTKMNDCNMRVLDIDSEGVLLGSIEGHNGTYCFNNDTDKFICDIIEHKSEK